MLDKERNSIKLFYNDLLKNKTKIIKHINTNYDLDDNLHISNFYKILHYLKNYKVYKLKYFVLDDFVERQLYKVIELYTGYTTQRIMELIAFINIYNIDNFKY